MSFRYYDPEQVGGLLVYRGSRRQHGAGLLDSLKRIALPIGKSLAKRGLRVGVGAVADKLRGGPDVSMKTALSQRAAKAADKAIVDYLGSDKPDLPFTSQDGFGIRRRRRRTTTKKPAKRGSGAKRQRSKPINKMKSKAKRRRRKAPKKKQRLSSDIFA